jgi:diguanylate cyclase (GGDEF)-like protein
MSSAADASQRRILVVDDDDHTRVLLKDLCETAGYRVSVAEDGNQAWDSICREAPDLVLLDLMMPRRDGFSVLKAVREKDGLKDLPIIILTAMGDMDGKIRGMELGADDYVTKPFKLVELQTRITSALMVREYRRRLIAAEEELAQLRAIDPVTGAGTYSQLKVSLDSELARSRRYGRPAACLVFGFDDYQGIRYQLGRDGCDQYLGRVANALREALRGADRLFRVDSDQFVALLPETDFPGARLVADRMQKTIATVEATGQDGKLTVVTRFGGAIFPHEKVHSSEDLLRQAHKSYLELATKGTQVVFGE